MLIPHLHFCGDCPEAIALYETAFNTKVDSIIFTRDIDPDCNDDSITHAAMKIHGQLVYLNNRFGKPSHGTDIAMHMIVTFETKDELLAAYEVLKPNSMLVDPLEELPYSPLSVQFVDRFGVQWGFMVQESAKHRANIYPVILTDYNPEWPIWYEDEKTKIIQIIGMSDIARIQHYGSTSIPDMFAKPTVDILLAIPKTADIERLKTRMVKGGYICLDETKLTIETPPPHLMFLGGYLQNGFAERVFHIHVIYESDHEADEIIFRDYLIAHPDTAKEYATLKRNIWKNFEHDRDGYTTAKGAFIYAVTERAKKDIFLKNLHKLHTTPLGSQRIQQNLGLNTNDVVEWCRQKTLLADQITRKGKNWYIHIDNAVITVNARSYTIITAHQSKH